MASTSCSSAVISSDENRTMYDVFLSFRGEDTRNSFTDHLYQALARAGFLTFRDNDAIDRGEDLKPEIEKAIKASKASIIVLSENYAKSRWCLDELLSILEQRKNFNHFVLPLFYKVDPSDVRNQRKSFAMEVDDRAKGSAKWTEHYVNKWKAALTEVANLTGMVLDGAETNFIAKIVKTIDSKLDLKLVSTPAHLTGIDTRAEPINSWLKNKQSSAQVLAICGMGGSGKTTLAKYIYNSNSGMFESSSFLEEVGKHCEQPHGLFELQKQLLKDILGGNNKKMYNISGCTGKIEVALQRKRVLIVIDDVEDCDQLAALLGTRAFNTQSKIVITTRDLGIYTWFESTSRSCQVYRSQLMNDHESLELLNWHAFGSRIPMEGFKKLAAQVAEYCAGNPLALKVLGSSLFVSAEDPRNRNSIVEIWRDTLNLLKRDFHTGIQGILRRSFDSLPFDSHRELFLHIACFFVGEDEEYVVKILEHDWYAKAGILTLINRCLITISPSNKLTMHQLLQEMGRKIVRDDSRKDPAKRSRVWSDDESYAVLSKGEGSKTIEGLALDMLNLKQRMRSKSLALETEFFTKMDNLKLLQLKYAELTGSYEKFPEGLRWLCWHGFHLRTIPLDLYMGNMVVLEMINSNLEQFEPPIVLQSLKVLNLKGSYKLVSIRNLDQLPNLETLILWNCGSLADVSETIGDLKSLALLDLTGCKSLWKVSSKSLFSLPHSLESLFLNNCNLGSNNHVPVVFSGQPFFYMNLGNNQFEFLPDYIDLQRLRALDLSDCHGLESLLGLPSTLEELYTYNCISLEKITFQSVPFSLRKFGYRGCYKLSEIEGLFKLVSIAKLDETDLGHMKWLKAHQNHEVGLIGDEIRIGTSILHIQMLYEYGIRSTFLPGFIKEDPNMASDYMSSFPHLSFRVPSSPKKRMIQGLNATFLYRSSSDQDEGMWVLFAKISNKTKGLTWIYNPVVFCKPRVGEDALWLSYWPIGNILDTGDEVNVCIIVGNGLTVSGCGASLVYTDDEVDKENWKSNMKWKEVIGGDLSEFELSTGGYYLCRRDFFKSMDDGMTTDWFNILFGDTIHYTEIQGWRKPRWLQQSQALHMEQKTSRGLPMIVLRVDVGNRKQILKMLKTVVAISGIQSVSFDNNKGLVTTVYADVDPVCVCSRIMEIVKTVEVISVG